MKLSLVVIAFNEERNLPRCLASAEGLADEILVVDSHSVDRTREVACSAGARVVERDWPGYGAQVEFAVSEARYDWVLRLDADETLSPELREEIAALKRLPEPPQRAWRMRRRDWFYDRWLRSCSGWFIRLAHRDAVRLDRYLVHESWRTDEPVGSFRGFLNHYSVDIYHQWTSRFNRYAYLGAVEAYRAGRRFAWWRLLLSPVWAFLRLYLVKGDILSGWPGLFHSVGYAHYTFARYATMWELARGHLADDGA